MLKSLRPLLLPACMLSIAVLAYLAGTVFREVYDGSPPSIAVSSMRTTCSAADASRPCEFETIRLNPGRFNARTRGPASRASLIVEDSSALANVRVLALRAEAPGRFVIGRADAAPVAVRDVARPGARLIVTLPDARDWNQITFEPARADAPIVVSEVGFYATDRDLRRSSAQPVQRISADRFSFTIVPALILGACVLMIVAAGLAPDRMRRPLPWLLTVLCISASVLNIGTAFSPFSSHDIRAMLGGELLVSRTTGNLTASLYEGSRIVQGLGETVNDGAVQWHRMPGYGLLCALAAIVGRTTDVVEIASIVVLMQVLVYAASIGVFVRVAERASGAGVACVLGVLMILLPAQLHYVQVDTIIPAFSILVLAALLVHLSREEANAPTLSAFLLVNAAFALWFFFRNDVLVGWIVVSGVLAGRRWLRWLVPITLIVAIALPWALYKRQYRHELNVMPTNAGEVLFLSLCEVPGSFPYECTDGGYFEWSSRAGYPDATQQAASNGAIREVVRHWATYPVHFSFMIATKLRRAILDESFPGFKTRTSVIFAADGGLFPILAAVLALSLALGHRRRRSLLLGWALFLNMPLFFVAFASHGRFYGPAGISLLAGAVPVLLESGFYDSLRRQPWRAATVIACVALFLIGGPSFERLVQSHDAIHYWTPLLDPARSTLRFSGH